MSSGEEGGRGEGQQVGKSGGRWASRSSWRLLALQGEQVKRGARRHGRRHGASAVATVEEREEEIFPENPLQQLI